MPWAAGGVEPTFIDYRGGDELDPVLEALRRVAPHVVVVFRPEMLPAGAMAGVCAPVLGFITEPLPRKNLEDHPDLNYNLAELRKIDAGNVDRVVCFDAVGWRHAAPLMPLWRSMPLPVDDRLYRRPRPSAHPPRIIFIGYSTMHREQSLLALKHEFDLRHYAHALIGEDLRRVLDDADVGLNVHGARWINSFENRVLLHLAAGHLVISEPLVPRYGLEPGADYVQVVDRPELDLRVHQVMQQPDAYDRVRIRGHHTSRQYAASKVWPRVVRDLFDDLAAFGTARRVSA